MKPSEIIGHDRDTNDEGTSHCIYFSDNEVVGIVMAGACMRISIDSNGDAVQMEII